MDRAGVDAALTRRRQHPPEDGDLLQRRGEVGLVGPREVAVDPLQREAGIGRHGLQQRGRLLGSHAHSPHSGVDLDVNRDGAAALPGAGREQLRVAGVMDDGHEIAGDGFARLGRVVDASEHEDRNAHAGVAQRGRLGDGDHGEATAAGLDERAGDGGRPVPVAVGLDHGDDFAARGEIRRGGEIRANRREPDGGHRRTLALHPTSPRRRPPRPRTLAHNVSKIREKRATRFDTQRPAPLASKRSKASIRAIPVPVTPSILFTPCPTQNSNYSSMVSPVASPRTPR